MTDNEKEPTAGTWSQTVAVIKSMSADEISSEITRAMRRQRGMMGAVANQPKTPHRTVRVPDEVWLPAVKKAKAEDTTLSEKIREWLTTYVEDAS